MEDSVLYKTQKVEGAAEACPLTGVKVDAVVKDTSIETVIRQHYVNCEVPDIESVYTFPLPVGATLLSLSVELNGRCHTGLVVESSEADERYEEAIENGDTAMRLQQINDSLYTLNLGNLQQNDTAVIEIRYAQLLYWQEDDLRILIPFTIGPRYGDPSKLGMLPHEVPETSLSIEHNIELSVCIEGELAKAKVSCPSHKVAIQSVESSLRVDLVEGVAAMDRDFVLLIHRTEQNDGFAYFDQDLEGRWVAWIPVNPQVEASAEPRQVTIVVDCSGSMGGASIHQAKNALREIVEQLRPEDSFSIINFGSSWQALFGCLKHASDANKKKAYRWIERTDADMGGTEVQAALNAAYSIGEKGAIERSSYHADVLLITDGETYDVPNLLKNVSLSKSRHFTVGVGTSVAEDMVRGVAEASGGACELVSPNENMAQSIVRHFKRMYMPSVTASEVVWPQASLECIPAKISRVFSGDTLHLFAKFERCPEGSATINLSFGKHSWRKQFTLQSFAKRQSEEAPSLSELTLARLAVSEFLRNGDGSKETKIMLGVNYQLQSTLTNYLMVVERDKKNESEFGPELRKVPGMLQAGWGGTSSHEMLSANICEGTSEYPDSVARLRRPQGHSTSSAEYLDMPAFMRRSTAPVIFGPTHFGKNLNDYSGRWPGHYFKALPKTIDELLDLGVSDNVAENLRILIDIFQVSEQDVVNVFLNLFSQTETAKALLSKSLIRCISKVAKKCIAHAELSKAIRKEVGFIVDGKGWVPVSYI